MCPPNKVFPLKTMAFFKIIIESWLRSGTLEHLIQINFQSFQELGTIPQVAFISSSYRQLQKILNLDCLPKTLLVKMGNCWLDFEREFQEFAMVLITALKEKTMKNMTDVLLHVVVTPDGHIDRRQTVTNIILDENLYSVINRSVIGYYCITDERIARLIMREESPHLEIRADDAVKCYTNPLIFWWPMVNARGIPGQYLQGAAIFGPTESLEYFYEMTKPEERQTELAKTAVRIVYHKFNVEKLLFFYNKMDSHLWLELLRRNFLVIFKTFFESKRYRHMCTVFFGQVRENLEYHDFATVLKSLVDAPNSSNISIEIERELFLDEWETILLSVWRMTPPNYRGSCQAQIFTIVNTLLTHNKMQTVLAIIEDPVIFSKEARMEIVNVVMLNTIMKDDADLFEQLNDWIQKSGHPFQRSNLESYSTFKLFVNLGDNLENCDKYDALLELIIISTPVQQRQLIKQMFLTDYEFVFTLVERIKRNTISIENFMNFLMWICSYDTDIFNEYVESCQLHGRNLRGEVCKSFVISNRNCFCNLTEVFNLTDQQIEDIRLSMAEDKATLFDYCYNIIKHRCFSELPRMLINVFENENQREEFLIEFFQSPMGYEAVNTMLVDNFFDFQLYCSHRFRHKLNDFQEFKKYFARSTVLCNGLLKMLQDCRSDQTANPPSGLYLFSHESLNQFNNVYDANVTFLKCILWEN